ncbi:hypothetical protein SAMN05421539_10265 [Jannaschia seohaensis]|uniref:Uncharacterized protein n=1 Tax=Jannaschia seohaensis TaxID=475081 RepID=A0A2Y9AF75_9RHOB|nr:hypothetical protein BCF38_10265 [Jannaschia seohaensis]SSA41229.1 hypothetical protein SAMN05421539_10265 [Jannaschia seohaensis]
MRGCRSRGPCAARRRPAPCAASSWWKTWPRPGPGCGMSSGRRSPGARWIAPRRWRGASGAGHALRSVGRRPEPAGRERRDPAARSKKGGPVHDLRLGDGDVGRCEAGGGALRGGGWRPSEGDGWGAAGAPAAADDARPPRPVAAHRAAHHGAFPPDRADGGGSATDRAGEARARVNRTGPADRGGGARPWVRRDHGGRAYQGDLPEAGISSRADAARHATRLGLREE